MCLFSVSGQLMYSSASKCACHHHHTRLSVMTNAVTVKIKQTLSSWNVACNVRFLMPCILWAYCFLDQEWGGGEVTWAGVEWGGVGRWGKQSRLALALVLACFKSTCTCTFTSCYTGRVHWPLLFLMFPPCFSLFPFLTRNLACLENISSVLTFVIWDCLPILSFSRKQKRWFPHCNFAR